MIITAASFNLNCKRFFDTYHKYVSEKLLLINFLPHFDHFFKPCCEVKRINRGYPGHIEKYRYFNFLPDGFLDENEFYIYLDTYDVIFQSDINFSDKDMIYVSGERWTWQENRFYEAQFQRFRQLEIMKDKQIYCSGTYAMRGNKFKKLITFMLCNQVGSQLNQPLFNYWLHTSGYEFTDSDQFGTLADNLGKSIKKRQGKFYKDGKLIPVVHGNGSFIKYLR